MEKTNRRVEKIGEGTRLRSGRVALGEITNVVTRDRRKPCLVKRVTTNQVKCTKRPNEAAGYSAIIKRSKESSIKCHQTRGKAKDNKTKCTTSEDVESTVPDNLTSQIMTLKELELTTHHNRNFTEKCRVTVHQDLDPERTVSCETTKKSRIDIETTMSSSFINCSDFLIQYEQEIYEYLLKLERERALQSDHLKDKKITGKMRQVVIDWLFEVQNHFRICQESIELTVVITDTCLAIDPTINQDNVQLVCLAAMFISIKYEETFLLELSDLRYVCDYCYQEKEILDMERRVLRILDFNLSYSLRTNFTGIYLKALERNHTIEKLIKYYVDLSLIEYKLASVHPSMITSACLYMALCVFQGSVQQTLANISIYDLLDLRQVILILAMRAISYIEMEKGGIYNKHLRDTKPGSLKHIVKSDIYHHTLKQICAALQ